MEVKIGIIEGREIEISIRGPFDIYSQSQDISETKRDCTLSFSIERFENDSIELIPASNESSFRISDVEIGRNFHWQQKENQEFNGILEIRKFHQSDDTCLLIAINRIDIEEYLTSVISSEMNPLSPLELLKAHAVISRSWVISRILEDRNNSNLSSQVNMPHKRIVWYDNDGHHGYDVCADDHCQRYQGILRINNKAREAVALTAGLILTHDGKICDTRFSKCCGGAFERFENCWENIHIPYLKEGRDIIPTLPLPDLTCEEDAERWIMQSPDSFCNVYDTMLLKRILNSYDLSNSSFFRWKVEYTQQELQEIIKEKSGINFGEIIDIIPLKRGVSGRISVLKIIGKKHSLIVGKELEIRRILSKSHLYSSAFIIRKNSSDISEIPASFIFFGAGWGHGVGLCQIGAAVMAEKGYTFEEILSHYYPSTSLKASY